MNEEQLEDAAMLIISNAGAARSCAYEALGLAKKGEEYAAKIAEAKEYSHAAHAAHSQLLKAAAKGEIGAVDLLISHAQDHLMTGQLALELIEEMIELYNIIKKERLV